jgi:hypothetical protein
MRILPSIENRAAPVKFLMRKYSQANRPKSGPNDLPVFFDLQRLFGAKKIKNTKVLK